MNKTLPIYNYAREIIEVMNTEDTLIITAETGSGKSTQVPQYLYEAGYNVIVTQPRRIACVTLADRVAEELGARSNVVGYQTAFEQNVTADTKILFCTDGLQMAKGIKDYRNTILVLDEVHEWNLNVETLIAWIKRFRSEGNFIKVILMSATVDTEKLSEYFDGASIISAPGRNYDVEIKESGADSVEDWIEHGIKIKKNMLVFVDGKAEIDKICASFEEREDCVVLPLHGELDTSSQKLCFKHYTLPKVIVSTNIAQTSVTIDDIDMVIDTGKQKINITKDGVDGLYSVNISKSDCLQRAGRAGRTKDGLYVLCSVYGLNDREEYMTPEIQRMSLDKVVLKLLSVGIDARTLQFYHSPKDGVIEKSFDTLKLIGAIDANDKITEIGKRINYLPVSCKYGRMLLEAEKYGCCNLMIKAVSILENGTLVNWRFKDSYGCTTDYCKYTKERRSDLLAEIEIFDNITNHKYKNLSAIGLSYKSYQRVSQHVKKLTEIIDNQINLKNDKAFNYSGFVRCLTAGMPDNIMFLSYSAERVFAEDDARDYMISKNTCTCVDKLLIGIPKIIEYKNKRYGCMDTLNIVDMISSITIDDIIATMPDRVEIHPIDDDDIEYLMYSNAYEYNQQYTIKTVRGNYIYNTIVRITKENNSELFKQLEDKRQKEEEILHKRLEEEAKLKAEKDRLWKEACEKRNITLNGKAYEISAWEVDDEDPHVYIYEEDADAIGDGIYDPVTGRKVRICVYGKFMQGDVYTTKEVKDKLRIINQEDERKKMIKFIDTHQRIKTVEEYKEAIDSDFMGKDLDGSDNNYIGMEFYAGRHVIQIRTEYSTEDEAKESCEVAFKELAKDLIYNEFDTDAYTFKDGARSNTIKALQAKGEFKQFVDMIVEDVTPDNFEELLDIAKDMYKETLDKAV